METKPVTTIRIFLASSNELKDDRDQFAAFIARLNKHYEPRGFEFVFEVWEFTDPAYNNKRKQDEYNALIRQSDYFVALFYTKAGKYTVEELKVARKECESRQMPLFIYFRDLSFWQVLRRKDKKLEEIKQYIGDDMKHFWGSYNNNDKLHLDFVLWLDNKLNQNSAIKVEGDDVKIGDLSLMPFSKLPFALNNSEYQRLVEQLAKLDQDIIECRQDVAEYPENKKFSERLSQKVLAREKLLKEVQRLQEALLGAAKRIAELRKQQVSDKLAKAVNAFENGQLEMANIYLDELKQEGEQLYKEILSRQDELKIKNEQMHGHIDALGIQAQTVMADTSIPIEERITQIRTVYAKADKWAAACSYPEEKYAKLLFDYASFLYKYAYYSEAAKVYLRQISFSEKLYGTDHLDTATSYNNIGAVYHEQGKYDLALKYFNAAIGIRVNVLGENHPDIATSYNNIAMVYHEQGKYDLALKYFNTALKILRMDLGEDHPNTAISYNNIGLVYEAQGKYDDALKYFNAALKIYENVLGEDDPSIAMTYNNIGLVYEAQGEYDQALKFYNAAIVIYEKVLGGKHPEIATAYNNIGMVYYNQGDYAQALKLHNKALGIREEMLGEYHTDTAMSYNNIGLVYDAKGDYGQALEYYNNALKIYEKVLGEDHPSTATLYNNIGSVWKVQGKYDYALNCYKKALEICEKVLGEDHPDTAVSYNNMGAIYDDMENYAPALKYYKKALSVKKKLLGENHPNTAVYYNNIGGVYYKIFMTRRWSVFIKHWILTRRRWGQTIQVPQPATTISA